MARVDDYLQAKQLAIEHLQKESFQNLVQQTGFDTIDDHTFRVPLLDRIYEVTYPEFDFKVDSDETTETPIQEHVIILHYMQGAKTKTLDGTWVTYREIPEASFYYSVFVKRAIDPLKNVFGQNIAGFEAAAQRLSGQNIEHGDTAFEFRILPKIPIQTILWQGDDEFPPEASILFDRSISNIFSPEDIAWLSGMLVYRLIALAKSHTRSS
jgi:hypothetical protein